MQVSVEKWHKYGQFHVLLLRGAQERLNSVEMVYVLRFLVEFHSVTQLFHLEFGPLGQITGEQ